MEFKIALCGDIMPGADVAQRIGGDTLGEWLQGVSAAWQGADLVIGNLECPCVLKAEPNKSSSPELVFHAPASRLEELAAAGFSAVTIANNHILNCGRSGLAEMIEGLGRAGLYHAGAGMNLAEAMRPAFIPVRSTTVALVAFCYDPPATSSKPGAAPHDRKTMRRALKAARAGADFVIAALHDGLEYSDVPPSETRRRFRFLAENGADLVIGHHPHVLQGLEWIGRVPVAYSLGDFLFHNSLPYVAERNFRRMAMGLYAPEEIKTDPDKFSRGAVLTVEVSSGQKSLEWHPFKQDPDLRPRLCSGDEKLEDLRKLDELSAALLNKEDRRHALADSVMQAVQWDNDNSLRARQLMRLALRPKWRYLPKGMRWLLLRLKVTKRASLSNSTEG